MPGGTRSIICASPLAPIGIASANRTTSSAGEDKKGLAASVERSELTNSDLRFEEALERRKDAILIAGEQAMQEKKVSARLETSAGG